MDHVTWSGLEVRMFSVDEKARLLEELWASGLTLAAAARLPGMPSRDTLRRWVAQADAGKIPVRRPERPQHVKHAPYEPAVKLEALRLASMGVPTRAIRKRLNIASRDLIRSWERAVRDGRLDPRTGRVILLGREGRHGMSERDDAATDEEVAELRLQVSVLKELIEDPKALGPGSLSNRRKAELGERLRQERGVSLRWVLTFFRISKSSYEYARAHPRRPGRPDLDALVAEAFAAGGGAYGYRRVRELVARHGARVSEKVVRRSMRRQGLVARGSRTAHARRYSSYAGEVAPAPPNLLLGEHGRHDFRAGAPNRVWVTDISEFTVPAGKLYLSSVIDCFDGRLEGDRVSRHPDSRLTDGSLLDACTHLGPGQAPVTHSDRGVHYRSHSWERICSDNGLVRSMSRKGHCPDNARCEGFFGTLKSEHFYGVDWSDVTLDELADDIRAWCREYNGTRLKAFREGGRTVYETIDGRRRRLGLAC